MAWKVQKFDELTLRELYQILQLRINVFVVEQQTFYEDLDNHDENSFHLSFVEDGKLLAYARVLPPGEKFDVSSIGRVIVHPDARGRGLAKELMQQAMAIVNREWEGSAILIQAQTYLQDFYGSFGFIAISEPYSYDGLPHTDMVYEPKRVVTQL